MTTAAESGPAPLSPLFADLVDDTSLLGPRVGAPGVDAVLAAHLSARDGEHGGVVGQLACPVSRLPSLVAELVRARPARPVDLALVVDTGLGALPKALSTVASRPNLLIPRTVHTAAPPDVDPVWLERVAEFVPDDVVAVVEPRRPTGGTSQDTTDWLDAVRRVAEHGCTPKLRCGGPRPSDEPSTTDVERFMAAVAGTGRGFIALGLQQLVRAVTPDDSQSGGTGPGVLNLLVAVARATGSGELGPALASTDGAALAAELAGLDAAARGAVRALLARCGTAGAPTPLVGVDLRP